MTVKIVPNDKGNPQGKLADAEVHFLSGPLEGLKLLGFAVWERKTGSGRNVTFPSRQYSVNGERRSFALLRPIADVAAHLRARPRPDDQYTARLPPAGLSSPAISRIPKRIQRGVQYAHSSCRTGRRLSCSRTMRHCGIAPSISATKRALCVGSIR